MDQEFKPKHILILTDNLDCGGAQDLIYNYIKYIDSSRFKLIVCNLSREGIYSSKMRELGVEVLDLNSSQFNVFVIFKVMKILKEKKEIEIIHSQFGKSHLFAPILGRIFKKKVMIHNHSGICDEHLLPYLKIKVAVILYRAILLWLFRWVNIGIGINKENRKDFVKFKPSLDEVFTTLYNGIDVEKFEESLNQKENLRKEIREQLNISEEDYILINIARLSNEKGHSYLIHAMEAVLKSNPDAKLLIVGKGNEDKRLKDLVRYLNLSSTILFLGERNDVPKLLAGSDLFVLPSLKEPFGLVLLEAMTMKVPVIVTNSGGPAEFIQDRVNGLKVEPKNTEALSKTIIEVMTEPVSFQSVVQSGYNTAHHHFDIKKIVNELEKIYLNL